MKYKAIYGLVATFCVSVITFAYFIANKVPGPTDHAILDQYANAFITNTQIDRDTVYRSYEDYDIYCSGVLNGKPVKFWCNKHTCQWILSN